MARYSDISQYKITVSPGEYVDDLIVEISGMTPNGAVLKHYSGDRAQRLYLVLNGLFAEPNDKNAQKEFIRRSINHV